MNMSKLLIDLILEAQYYLTLVSYILLKQLNSTSDLSDFLNQMRVCVIWAGGEQV